MQRHFWQNLPIILSLVIAILALPLLLAAVKTNQDIRSQALERQVRQVSP